MSSSAGPCIVSNPDISGFGVRLAIYAQAVLSFVPAIYALRDRKVTLAAMDALQSQSTMILLTGFAVLITAIIRALTIGLNNSHTTIILYLSWMNNTNTFVYVLLYIYQRMGERAQEKDGGSLSRGEISQWVESIKEALQTPVSIFGSLHLTLMAAVGMLFWNQPTSSTCLPSYPISTFVFSLGGRIPLSSMEPKGWLIFIYGLLFIPGLNLALVVGFFTIPYVFYIRTTSDPSKLEARITRTPVIIALTILAVINALFLADIEVSIIHNRSLLALGKYPSTFGQILALMLMLISSRNFLRQGIFGKKLSSVPSGGEVDAMRYNIEEKNTMERKQ